MRVWHVLLLAAALVAVGVLVSQAILRRPPEGSRRTQREPLPASVREPAAREAQPPEEAVGTRRAPAPEPESPVKTFDSGAEPTAAEGRTPLPPGPSFAVRVRVVDAAGEPIPWATVEVGDKIKELSGPDGRVTGHLPRRDRIRIYIRHRLYLQRRVDVDFPEEELVVTLEEGTSVSGRVRSPAGEPLPGVWVKAGRGRVLTDADGAYRITGLEPGPVTVSCFHWPSRITRNPTVHPRGRETRKAARAGDTDVDFELVGRIFRLRILDDRGRPFENAVVGLLADWDRRFPLRQTGPTDGAGFVETIITRSRPVRVSVVAPDHAPVTFEIPPGETPLVVEKEVILQRVTEGATIAVRARDDWDRPLSFVLLTLVSTAGPVLPGYENRRIELDEAGTAGLARVPPGKHRAIVSTAKRFRSVAGFGLETERVVSLEPGREHPLDVVITMGGRICVTARNEAGEIIKPGRIVLRDETRRRVNVSFGPSPLGGRVYVDPVPHLSWAPLPPGEYQLEFITGLGGPGKVRKTLPAHVERNKTTEVEVRFDE